MGCKRASTKKRTGLNSYGGIKRPKTLGLHKETENDCCPSPTARVSEPSSPGTPNISPGYLGFSWIDRPLISAIRDFPWWGHDDSRVPTPKGARVRTQRHAAQQKNRLVHFTPTQQSSRHPIQSNRGELWPWEPRENKARKNARPGNTKPLKAGTGESADGFRWRARAGRPVKLADVTKTRRGQTRARLKKQMLLLPAGQTGQRWDHTGARFS